MALPSSLADELADHVSRYPAVGDGLVFSGPEGGPLRRTNFSRRVWLPAVRESVGEPMRFHDLRHTHAAWLVSHGSHPKTIQVRLGHASISTTLNTYGHLMPGMDEDAADALDAAMKHSGSTEAPASVSQIRRQT